MHRLGGQRKACRLHGASTITKSQLLLGWVDCTAYIWAPDFRTRKKAISQSGSSPIHAMVKLL